MRARVLRGIGANLYGQLVTTLIQVVSVPLFLAAWGPSRFGTWTLLSAAPAVLVLADGGWVLASGNAMAMLAGRGDRAGAALVFRHARRKVCVVLAAAGLGIVLTLHLLPPGALGRLGLPPGRGPVLLEIAVAVTLLGVAGALPGAALRADGRYALGTSLAATMRIADGMAPLVVAMRGGDLPAAALAWLAARCVGTAVLFIMAHAAVDWLKCRDGDPARLPALGPAARAAALIPASFAIGLQGVTLAVGLALAPGAVAAFTAARTLARVLVQAAGLVIHAVMPEMARAAGQGDAAAIAAVRRLGGWSAGLILVPGWALLMGCGPHVFALWCGDRLTLPAGTLPLLVTAALLHGLWLSQANLLLAVNRQAAWAGPFCLVTFATVAGTALAASIAGLPGAAAATLLGEAAMLAWILRVGRRLPWAFLPAEAVP